FRSRSAAGLSVTRSSGPHPAPVFASSGTRQMSTFSTRLAKAMRSERAAAGLRSIAVPNVRRCGTPTTGDATGEIESCHTFELAFAVFVVRTPSRFVQADGIGNSAPDAAPALWRASKAPVLIASPPSARVTYQST